MMVTFIASNLMKHSLDMFTFRSRQAGGLDVRRVGGVGPLPPHPHHRRQLRGLPQEPAEDDQGGEGQEEAEGRQDL